MIPYDAEGNEGSDAGLKGTLPVREPAARPFEHFLCLGVDFLGGRKQGHGLARPDGRRALGRVEGGFVREVAELPQIIERTFAVGHAGHFSLAHACEFRSVPRIQDFG